MKNKKVILELKDIVKYYNEKQIINDAVSLKICEGDIVGLVGESGCGKSTLAKIIIGLENQNSGNIFFKNNEVTFDKRKRIRKDMQIIFQNPVSALDPKMNILDIVSEPLLLKKKGDKDKIENKVRDALKYVNLEEKYYKRRINQLSGGQCQRVAIARALVTYPKLLVCDEITSALDVCNQHNIMEIIKKYAKEHKVAILFITHNIKLATQLCNKMVVMKDGKIVENGDTKLMLKKPSSEYVKMLINF